MEFTLRNWVSRNQSQQCYGVAVEFDFREKIKANVDYQVGDQVLVTQDELMSRFN
jgi:hypothetical protein